jgi:hypothetical protein
MSLTMFCSRHGAKKMIILFVKYNMEDNTIAHRILHLQCVSRDYVYVFSQALLYLAFTALNVWYLTILDKDNNCAFPLYELGITTTSICISLMVYSIILVAYMAYMMLNNPGVEEDHNNCTKALAMIMVFMTCIIVIAGWALVGLYIALIVFAIKYSPEECDTQAFDYLPEYLIVSFSINLLLGFAYFCNRLYDIFN